MFICLSVLLPLTEPVEVTVLTVDLFDCLIVDSLLLTESVEVTVLTVDLFDCLIVDSLPLTEPVEVIVLTVDLFDCLIVDSLLLTELLATGCWLLAWLRRGFGLSPSGFWLLAF